MSVAVMMVGSFQLMYALSGICATCRHSLMISIFFSPVLDLNATDKDKFRNVHIWNTDWYGYLNKFTFQIKLLLLYILF